MLREEKYYVMSMGEAIFVYVLMSLLFLWAIYQHFHINQKWYMEIQQLRSEIGTLDSNANLDRQDISNCRSMAAVLWQDYYTRFPDLLKGGEYCEKDWNGADSIHFDDGD